MDRAIPKVFWTKNRIIITTLLTLVAGFIIYQIFFADKRSKLSVDEQKLTISAVTEGTFDEFIIVQGAVQPLKTIQLDAVVGGYVTQKLVEGGSMVKHGEVILKLENQQLKLNFLQSETEASRLVNELQNTRQRLKVERFNIKRTLNNLDFDIAQAKDEYERNGALSKDRVISDLEYQRTKRTYDRLVGQKQIEIESQKYQEENASIQIKQLESTLERTQKNVDLWRQTLENLVVKAPVAGLLSSINVEIGSNINQGQNIGQIDDLNGFKIRADIDQHYIARVFIGLKAFYEFDNTKHELEVIKIYPEVLNGRFGVDMSFVKKAPDGIRRGQSTTIRLELGNSAQALLLPVGGFFSDTGGNWGYVADGNGRAIKKNITLGRRNPQYYEVIDGLKAGDQVVTSSYSNFGDKEILELNK